MPLGLFNRNISKAFDSLSLPNPSLQTSEQLGEMASSLLLQLKVDLLLPMATFAFPLGADEVITGICHLSSPIKPFCQIVSCSITDFDMTTYDENDISVLAAAFRIVKADGRVNQIKTLLVGWADRKVTSY